MHRFIAVFLLAALAADARAVTIQWSAVGNAGNANDSTGFGAVGYNYNIGTKDVTNSQYAEFLNTTDPNGGNLLGLWNLNMAVPTYGGISFNGGNAPGSMYVLTAGNENHPASNVTFYDALRFANWVNNGQGNGATESGAYTLLGGTPTPSNFNSITRTAGATVFLPSENEWYKAAFYDPRTTAQGGPPSDSHYWQYATTSNSTPIASGPTALANHANWGNTPGNLTDVGAYSGTTSPVGAFDMNGNVQQWNESVIGGFARGLRAGDWVDVAPLLLSSNGSSGSPTAEIDTIGFRLVNIPTGYVPEPSSIVLAALALAGLMAWAGGGDVDTALALAAVPDQASHARID